MFEFLSNVYAFVILGGGVLMVIGIAVWGVVTGTWTAELVLILPAVWLLMWLFP